MIRFRKNKLPALPKKMAAPDAAAIQLLGITATTAQGRKHAHETAAYLERVIEVNDHNGKVAREALRLIREALGEVAA